MNLLTVPLPAQLNEGCHSGSLAVCSTVSLSLSVLYVSLIQTSQNSADRNVFHKILNWKRTCKNVKCKKRAALAGEAI